MGVLDSLPARFLWAIRCMLFRVGAAVDDLMLLLLASFIFVAAVAAAVICCCCYLLLLLPVAAVAVAVAVAVAARISIRPSCYDIYFYLGAPSEGRKVQGGGPTLSLVYSNQHHAGGGTTSDSTATERLLQHQAPDDLSAGAAGAAAAVSAGDMPYEGDELLGALEETAEQYASFLGLPGGGPCLTRSCCCLVAGAQQIVSLLLMWIDGSLTFISLGGLTLLCGGCFPAGLLLSGAPLFSATCAFSSAVTLLTKQLLFSLLHAHGGGAPNTSSIRRLGGGVAGGGGEGPLLPSASGYYRLAEEDGGAINTFKKIRDVFSIRDILNRLKSHNSSNSNSNSSNSNSSNSSIAEKQQQLLQRLHTGADLEAGGPYQDYHHHQQQQQQHPLGPVEDVHALSATAAGTSEQRQHQQQQQQVRWGDPQSYVPSSIEENEQDDFDEGTETNGDSQRFSEPTPTNT
ncbi:hypothetical protein ACSSS7_007702 [Eimeria intestinalis]